MKWPWEWITRQRALADEWYWWQEWIDRRRQRLREEHGVCRTCWGSHGCSKQAGHRLGHRCDWGCPKPYGDTFEVKPPQMLPDDQLYLQVINSEGTSLFTRRADEGEWKRVTGG